MSLGLKPLAMESSQAKEEAAAREQHERKRAEEKRAEQQRLADRVKECAPAPAMLQGVGLLVQGLDRQLVSGCRIGLDRAGQGCTAHNAPRRGVRSSSAWPTGPRGALPPLSRGWPEPDAAAAAACAAPVGHRLPCRQHKRAEQQPRPTGSKSQRLPQPRTWRLLAARERWPHRGAERPQHAFLLQQGLAGAIRVKRANRGALRCRKQRT